MKIYRLDESLTKPSWWLEEDKNNNPANKLWIEEGVLIFGRIVYMAKYRLVSRRAWKRSKKHRQNIPWRNYD
jgi:hypothetical protein